MLLDAIQATVDLPLIGADFPIILIETEETRHPLSPHGEFPSFFRKL